MWGSSVDFQNGAGIAYELDLHAGYSWSLSPDWSMQLGYVHYAYLDDDDAGYDYDEVSASLSYQQRATASVAWSPNTSKHTYWGFISEKQALAYELSLLQPLDPRWSLCAGVGYYDLHDLVDTGYWYWSAGRRLHLAGHAGRPAAHRHGFHGGAAVRRRQPLDGGADLALLEPR